MLKMPKKRRKHYCCRVGDKRLQGSFDLLLDPWKTLGGVRGRVWVELKTMKPQDFQEEVGKLQGALANKLLEVNGAVPSLAGVLLVVTRVGRAGSAWAHPQLLAFFKAHGQQGWADLSPKACKVAAGRVQSAQMPSLAEVWAQMEWHLDPETQKHQVGLLADFLVAHKLPGKTPGKRARTFNTLLKRAQVKARDRLRFLKLPNKRGCPKFWLGSKKCFRAVRKYCL